jgi:hypothetical protein
MKEGFAGHQQLKLMVVTLLLLALELQGFHGVNNNVCYFKISCNSLSLYLLADYFNFRASIYW